MEATCSTTTPNHPSHDRRPRPSRPLAILLLLALALSAAAQGRGRRGAPPAGFHSHGSGLGATAANGFDISFVNGEWRHPGHVHLGGQGRIASPWGEEMPIRFWFNPDGSLGVEYDRSATVHYRFDEFGGLGEIAVVTPAGVRSVFAGDRAQRAALGELDLYQLDYAPYEMLLAEIARNHSDDFLAGVEQLGRKLERVGRPTPAGCIGDILQCTGAILVWVASVPTIAAACTAGTAVTLGAACLGAILAHEGASAAMVGVCLNAIENCMDRGDPRGTPGGGCNGPDGGPE